MKTETEKEATSRPGRAFAPMQSQDPSSTHFHASKRRSRVCLQCGSVLCAQDGGEALDLQHWQRPRLLLLAPLQEPTSGAAMRGARVGGPHVRREGHATVTTTQPVQALRG